MNKIVNKFLLAGGKFMPELHLRQSGFTHNACRPFTSHSERIRKDCFLNYINKNEFDKVCFAHDAEYSDNKDLGKRTISNKILKDRAFKFTAIPIYGGYQGGLAIMVYTFFDMKTGSGTRSNVNEALAQKFQKPVIKKFRIRKVY